VTADQINQSLKPHICAHADSFAAMTRDLFVPRRDELLIRHLSDIRVYQACEIAAIQISFSIQAIKK